MKRGSRIAPLLSEVRASLGAVTTTQRSCDGHEHTVYWQESWKGRDIEGTYTGFRAPSPRDISEYPVIEVANVMAQAGLQQSRKALWLETLRLLGFTKQGTQIRATFKLAYAWAKAHRASPPLRRPDQRTTRWTGIARRYPEAARQSSCRHIPGSC